MPELFLALCHSSKEGPQFMSSLVCWSVGESYCFACANWHKKRFQTLFLAINTLVKRAVKIRDHEIKQSFVMQNKIA